MVRPLHCFALLCASLAFATHAASLHIKLTHVDAREGCTDEERMRSATERTHRRLASTKPARLYENQYIVDYLIGDPLQKAEALLDTASNLVWTQRASCSVCFRQDLPLYDPSASRAARNLTCGDAACAAGVGADVTECGQGVNAGACFVRVLYNAFQKIAGDLSSDEFTFGAEKVTLAFGSVGAADLTTGNLFGASGMMGLGRGPLSLVSQLGETKFSYCLTPFFGNVTNPSHLLVGASAVLSGGAPVTTVPFVKNPTDYPFSTYYYVPLAGISVGTVQLDVPAAAFDVREVRPGKWAGGAVLDTGAPFMSLVDDAFQPLMAELERQLGAAVVRPPKTVLGKRIVPPLVLHFGGAGDVVLPPENYWAPVGDDTTCMAVFSSARKISAPMNETTVIGSFMQQNMQVLYDLGKDVISFQPTDCSNFQPAPPGPPTGRTSTSSIKVKMASSSSSSENATLIAFGCVTANKLAPGSLGGASGVLGLGRGALSLVSQLGATSFSYCLTPYFRDDNVTTSHLFVGGNASGVLSGNASSSPVTSVPFYVPLSGISVGNATLDVPAAAFELRQLVTPSGSSWSGTLVDSGSPFTALVDVAYRALRTELARQIGAASLVPPPDEALDLCVARGDVAKLVPPMVLHFGGGGGDVVVPPENYWVPWDAATACMVVFSSAAGPNATLPMNETTVIGNYMQQDMHMLYDLGNGVLSFQQADCSSV
ncbi:hypothetical protein EJB05_01008, partial [Eragrostis curvula]